MFDITATMLIQLVNCMPFLLVFILVMNLIYEMLWGD